MVNLRHEPAPGSVPGFVSQHLLRSADESYIRKLHTFLDESYTCINIQESCIIIQRRTDPEGSAKVIRKVV